MSSREQVIEGIQRDASRADALQRQARELLVDAAHRGAAEGLSQREIAQAAGRSQPEVSRLLRQARPGPLALRVSQERPRMAEVLSAYDVTDARIFGSVATRRENPDSDVDLLIETSRVLGLGELSRLERDLAAIIDAHVDVVSIRSLPDYLRERALSESVPL